MQEGELFSNLPRKKTKRMSVAEESRDVIVRQIVNRRKTHMKWRKREEQKQNLRKIDEKLIIESEEEHEEEFITRKSLVNPRMSKLIQNQTQEEEEEQHFVEHSKTTKRIRKGPKKLKEEFKEKANEETAEKRDSYAGDGKAKQEEVEEREETSIFNLVDQYMNDLESQRKETKMPSEEQDTMVKKVTFSEEPPQRFTIPRGSSKPCCDYCVIF